DAAGHAARACAQGRRAAALAAEGNGGRGAGTDSTAARRAALRVRDCGAARHVRFVPRVAHREGTRLARRSADALRVATARAASRAGKFAKPTAPNADSPRSARRATSAAVDAELFEEAVSVAASFACTIDTQESLLDLLFVGPQAFCFTIGRGVAHADQMLE